MNENNIFYVFLFLSFFSLLHITIVCSVCRCLLFRRTRKCSNHKKGMGKDLKLQFLASSICFPSRFAVEGSRLPKRHNFCIKICLFRQPSKSAWGSGENSALLFLESNVGVKRYQQQSTAGLCAFNTYIGFTRLINRMNFLRFALSDVKRNKILCALLQGL